MRVGVIVFPGSCDETDALDALNRVDRLEAGFLWHRERDLRGADAIVIPGGFSYGDYLRPGAIARFSPVMEAISRFAGDGGPVLGICNGFQVLAEAGLVPGALLPNESLRFVCRQVEVAVESTGTPFTSALAAGEKLSVPVKHTTGRYYSPEPVRVVFKYTSGVNPNGSQDDIAGVANEAGNVVGLMPHPEHAVDLLHGSQDGLKLFASAAEIGAGV